MSCYNVEYLRVHELLYLPAVSVALYYSSSSCLTDIIFFSVFLVSAIRFVVDKVASMFLIVSLLFSSFSTTFGLTINSL